MDAYQRILTAVGTGDPTIPWDELTAAFLHRYQREPWIQHLHRNPGGPMGCHGDRDDRRAYLVAAGRHLDLYHRLMGREDEWWQRLTSIITKEVDLPPPERIDLVGSVIPARDHVPYEMLIRLLVEVSRSTKGPLLWPPLAESRFGVQVVGLLTPDAPLPAELDEEHLQLLLPHLLSTLRDLDVPGEIVQMIAEVLAVAAEHYPALEDPLREAFLPATRALATSALMEDEVVVAVIDVLRAGLGVLDLSIMAMLEEEVERTGVLHLSSRGSVVRIHPTLGSDREAVIEEVVRLCRFLHETLAEVGEDLGSLVNAWSAAVEHRAQILELVGFHERFFSGYYSALPNVKDAGLRDLIGRYPPGASLLLSGPSRFEGRTLVASLLEEYARFGQVILVRASPVAHRTTGPGTPFIIDLQKTKTSHVSGVEKTEEGLAVDEDLTSLGIALDQALREKGHTPMVAVDGLATILLQNGTNSTLEFLQTMTSKFSSIGAVSVWWLEEEGLSTEELQAIHEQFDVVLSLADGADGLHRRVTLTRSTNRFGGPEVQPIILRLGDGRLQLLTADDQGSLPLPELADETAPPLWKPLAPHGLPPGIAILGRHGGVDPTPFADDFANWALGRGYLIYLAADRPVEELGERLVGLQARSAREQGRLILLDGHRHRTETVIGARWEGNTAVIAADLTSVFIAIQQALDRVPPSADLAFLFDGLDGLLATEELATVARFLDHLLARLRGRGARVLVLTNLELIEGNLIARVRPLFELVLDLEVRMDRALVSLVGSVNLPYTGIRYPLITEPEVRLAGSEDPIFVEVNAALLEQATGSGADQAEDTILRLRGEVSDFQARLANLEGRIASAGEGSDDPDLQRARFRITELRETLDRQEQAGKRDREVVLLVAKVLPVLDDLLGTLIQEEVDRFAASAVFENYDRLMDLIEGLRDHEGKD